MFASLLLGVATAGQPFGTISGGRLVKPPLDAAYDVPAYAEYKFASLVDHDHPDGATFEQRFFMDTTLNGSILWFYVGGEGPIDGLPVSSGSVLWDFASIFGGRVVYSEHRYYGKTLPFGANSWTRPNVAYLNMTQALRDFAALIASFRNDFGVQFVVCIGGSYPGSMAAYMRMNHPEACDASIASSAPLLLYPSNTNVSQYAYFQKLSDVFGRVSPSVCPNAARTAYEAILSPLTPPSLIAGALGLCKPPATAADRQAVSEWLKIGFTNIGMGNLPWARGSVPAYPLDQICRLFASNPEPLAGAWMVGQYAYNASGNVACHDIAAEYVACSDLTGCGGNNSDAWSWDYECCTAITHDAGSNNVTDIFPPLPYSLPTISAYCQQRWGTTPDPAYNMQHLLNLSATRIVYSNGALDPWSVGGVRTAPTFDTIAFTIADGAHHADLWAPQPGEPASLQEARAATRSALSDWIPFDLVAAQPRAAPRVRRP